MKKSFAPHILGYDDTVFPQIHHAILAKHDFILLGLRGQGKSKLLKSLVMLLDEYVPVIKGSIINEDPYNPVLKSTKEKLLRDGDNTEIEWLHRSFRFSEKLATPDVSMSDLIGDIDPIKAANLGLTFSDPEIIDFGLIPKAHRCIFAINELADLQARIQVGLFNIMEEKNVQIKGFPIQFNLDVMLVYSANPEDYTARGAIITPLKDRIDSQIITHYPASREIGIKIIEQEVNANYKELLTAVPSYFKAIVEQIVIVARKSDLIDQSSGVSARLSISAMENVLASAEARSLVNNEPFMLRINDLYAAIPAITGKIELLYEGEQEGLQKIAQGLISKAILDIFKEEFGNIEEEGNSVFHAVENVKKWFEINHLDIDDLATNENYIKLFAQIKSNKFVPKKSNVDSNDEKQVASVAHFFVESMVMLNYLSKFKVHNRASYSDMMNSLFS